MINPIKSPAAEATPEPQANGDKRSLSLGREVPDQDVATSIPARFKWISRRFSDRVAVKMGGRSWSYAELDAQANRIARALMSAAGDEPVCVALLLVTGFPLFAAMMGVLKAGNIFVLVDPSHPRDRIHSILRDARAKFVLADQNDSLIAAVAQSGCRVMQYADIIDAVSSADVPRDIPPDRPATIIYTSGSTGEPKGVVWSHRGLLYRNMTRSHQCEVTHEDRVASLSSHTGNAMNDIFLALLNGATLMPFEVRQNGVARLGSWLSAEAITICAISSPVFRKLCETLTGAEGFPSLRSIRLRSDTVRADDLSLFRKSFPPGCALITGLSSAETGHITSYRFPRDCEPIENEVPVGYAVPGTEVFLVDDRGSRVDAGGVGEIVVRSRYLSLGYWQRPDLTEAKFKPDPHDPKIRNYFTGDLATARPDGCLIHKGRKDFRVKIRGYGVELGEVERVLRSHPALGEVAAVARKDASGEARLVAYYTMKASGEISVSEIRKFTMEKLPDYMIPAAFVRMDRLPLTNNGKVDRRALPDPAGGRPEIAAPFVAPRTDAERTVARIFSECTGIEPVGIEDNFFDLGGDSLLLARLVSRLSRAFGREISVGQAFESPSVAGMARLLESREQLAQPKNGFVPFATGDQGKEVLSFAQRRLWFFDQLHPGEPAYHLLAAFKIDGALNVAALSRALEVIVGRHEVLRTVFESADGEPRLRVRSVSPDPLLKVEDFSNRGDEEDLRRHCAALVRQRFDLSRGPLLRATLLRRSDDDHVLALVVHHIVFDGWSMGVLCRELSACYDAISRGGEPALPKLAVQYTDYARWQRESLQEQLLEDQLEYWRRQLAGTEPLQLLTDRRFPQDQSNRGAKQYFALSMELSAKLKRLSHDFGATVFMTLLAAYQLLLHRYTRQSDIAVGSPVAGRHHNEVEDLIGFFLNMVVLRVDVSGDPSFIDLLDRVRKICLEAYTHQDVPFDKLVEIIGPERDLGRTPFFRVTFAFQNTPQWPLELRGVSVSRLEVDAEITRFDLHLFMEQSGDRLQGYFSYDTSLFSCGLIEQMARHFVRLLEGIVADPACRLSRLALVTDAERRQAVTEWNSTVVAYPADKGIHALFEEQVERTPKAVAVVFGEQQLTYRELNERSNQLAHYLRRQGLGPEVLVGMCMERSVQMVVGMLGILKAGGAYVPLDPAYPKERLGFMLEDARAGIVLTDRSSLDSLPPTRARMICLDRDWDQIAQEPRVNPVNQNTADDLAYVIFTSGSTGVPKGVEVRHRGVARLLFGVDYVKLDGSRTFLHLAPISFDAATFEVWGGLLHGGKCVLFPGQVPSPRELGEVLKKHRVSTLWLTAALFNTVIDEEPQALSEVKQLLIGGEALSVPHVKKGLAQLPRTEIINGYGPTESTTFACCYSIPRQLDDKLSSIPIGRPIANTQVYILDPYLNPVPIGVPGELHIGGDGLARGYLNRPELTAEKFIPNPFSADPASRLYKTGDRARYLPDGNIEFLGRFDHQVKIRGFRIELGEIEAVLGRHPAVREAVVAVREDDPGAKRLVGYVVARSPGQPAASELRDYLKDKLPEYMIPAAFVFLDALPLTPNGKLDRKALPKPGPDDLTADVAPRTPIEQWLREIWAEVLGVERVGVHDNFFDRGGHSLMGIRLINEICKELQIDMPLRRLFECPTIATLAESLEADLSRAATDRRANSPWRYLIELKPGPGKRPVFFLPGGIGGDYEFLVYARLTHFVGDDFSFYGLRARSADGSESAHRSVEEMAADYLKEMRALQPEGPYYIVGNCIGGIVAYEIARQLKLQGQGVRLLALMDTWCPTPQRYSRYRKNLFRDRLKERIAFALAGWRHQYYIARMRFHWRQFQEMGWQERLPYLLRKTAVVVSDSARTLSKASGPANGAPHQTDVKRRQIQEGYIDTLRRYRPRPYPGRVVMLVNEKASMTDATLGWSELIEGGIETQTIPGDHEAYIRQYVKTAAGVLRDCLARASVLESNAPHGAADSMPASIAV
jgi:amino acid adenylation domain-containing protein